MGPGWLRPELPDGPLRDLNDALHDLHGRSGHRSTRFIADRLRAGHGTGAPSHSKVHQLFTRPELPRPELVLWVVQVLADTIRGLDPEAECDRFDHLWQLAYSSRGRPDAPKPASLADLDPAVWADLFPDAVDNISELHRTAHVNTIHALIGHYATMLVIRYKLFGPEHPDTLTARHNLAWWQGEVGSPEVALAAFERLSEVRKRVLGKDHPHAVSTRLCVAYYLIMTRELTRGLAMFEELLSARECLLGSDHPDSLDARRCFGWATGMSGDLWGAVHVLTELLSRQSRVLGDEHPDVLSVRIALVNWRGMAGEQAEALTSLEELLPELVRVLGNDHHRVLAARRGIIRLKSEVYGPEEVLEESDILLADITRALGAEHYTAAAHHFDNVGWQRVAKRRR